MIDNTTKISLTCNTGGEFLVQPEVTELIIDPTTKEVTYKVIQEEEMSIAKRHITLNWKFIEPVLKERPKYHSRNHKSREYKRWLNSPIGVLSERWNIITDERKLEFACRDLVEALTGISYRDCEMKFKIM